ncbi:MAG: hypothetical protein E7228_05185 [Clostridiales bacterium]|nr:hypothetical protein [Clostridiales bacterium]
MKKRVFYTELSYILGIVILAIGTVFMEHANLGMSMVVAPAYLVYLKMSQIFPFFTFGMAEYTLQAVILILMIVILRRFKITYFFSFITAILYGFTLDGAMILMDMFTAVADGPRIVFFLIGMVLCSIAVSLFFHTYIAPEAYELFVKEVSAKLGVNINKFKTAYDCTSCLIGIILSFIFFGMWHFEGVKIGTVFCALVNGFLIGRFSAFFEKHWEFKDRFDFKKYFQ